MMKHRNPDMLLYIAIADAYAAAVEYLHKNPGYEKGTEAANTFINEALCFERYLARPMGDLPAGSYTDDTEMSIANTIVLTTDEPPFTRQHFADRYVQEFVFGGRRRGYAQGFYEHVLSKVNNGSELLAIREPRSTANGACMRAVPFGALPKLEDALDVARTQASVTHDTPEGIVSAQYVAYLSWMSLWSDLPLAQLFAPGRVVPWHEFDDPEYAAGLAEQFRAPWPGIPVHTAPHGCQALATVHAVLHLLRTEQSLMDMLRTVIKWGGDTDSVASIAWGIASARYQDETLPAFMRRDLEHGPSRTGARRLRILGHTLMDTCNE